MKITFCKSPWSTETSDITQGLGSNVEEGLTSIEATERQFSCGLNQLHTSSARSWLSILLAQFKSLLVLLLVIATCLAFAFQDWIEGAAICIVIILNTLIGFFTELGAIRSMESLRKFNTQQATVKRDGNIKRIPSEQIVPGDLIIIDTGDVISADMRLLESSNLEANESLLTGESLPTSKNSKSLPEDTVLAERQNMLYKGTSITRGTATAIVTATGIFTELGNISSLVRQAEDEVTPLEKRLSILGRKLIIVTLFITGFTLIMGLLSGKELYLMIETSIALAVAAIPEGLPIIATLALARGMWRMSRSNVLINKLSAVETLGATNIICTDKTGTLTENRMSLEQIITTNDDHTYSDFTENHEPLYQALKVAALCNKASLTDTDEDHIGDPIEIALLTRAHEQGITRDVLNDQYTLLNEEAFDSSIKMMAMTYQIDDSIFVAVKGAAEAVLHVCSHTLVNGEVMELTEQTRSKWLEKNHALASDGFRVLALAQKTPSDKYEEPYKNLTFIALAGFIDPTRHDIEQTINECRNAGIRVIMITGDQPGTAAHVAKNSGIIKADETPRIAHGKEIPQLTEKEGLLDISIFARVTPKDKLDIIHAHQKNGSVVAMTGDGVNDAPALKKADIGIAMGKRGTEIAREASDMILKDDSFLSILIAIKQGRSIFNNIRKFVVYLMSCNLSEVFIVGIAAGFNAPLPLLPLQILFLNMVTDVFPAIALGASNASPGIMNQPPRKMSDQLIGRHEWNRIIYYSLIITLCTLGTFTAALYHFDLETKETVTISFIVLAIAQILHVFNITDPESGVLNNEVTKNPYVWGAVILCLGLLVAALTIPIVSQTLALETPSKVGWLLIIAGSTTPLIVGRLHALIKKIAKHNY